MAVDLTLSPFVAYTASGAFVFDPAVKAFRPFTKTERQRMRRREKRAREAAQRASDALGAAERDALENALKELQKMHGR